METGSGEESTSQIGGLQRSLAIRCDKGSPCSNCRASNIPCYASAGKRREAKQRVLVSASYEKKIDRIEERLAGIENILRASFNSNNHGTESYTSSTPSQFSQRHSPSATSLGRAKSECDQQDTDTFEGDTSLTAYSKYASKFLETAVEKTQIAGQIPEMAAALRSLRNIVNRQNSQPTMHGFHHAQQNSHHNLPLPPAQAVWAVLRHLEVEGSFSITIFFPFLRYEYFSRYCQDVFNGTGDYSLAVATVVHGSLYYLFQDASLIIDDQSLTADFAQHIELCRKNFEACLSSLTLLMPASFESVVALAIGAMYAVEMSRPSLCWMLTANAVGLCQTLGYHRANSSKNNSTDIQVDKTILFWVIYTMDKSLSIRLGRASSIQDYDISVPIPGSFFSDDPKYKKWTDLHKLWIMDAKIQGKIYEQLYSPGAVCKSADERVASVDRLVEELSRIGAEKLKLEVSPETAFHADLLLVMIRWDRVFYWSMMTLIYRAMAPPPSAPASTMHPACVDAARKALEEHERCSRVFTADTTSSDMLAWGSYLHWFIIHLPFTPFVVIFCNIISTTSLETRQSDLSRLTAFLHTLAPTPGRPHTSEAVEKLYHLCHVLHRVAGLYVDASSRTGGDTEMQTTMQQQEDDGLATWGNFGELEPYLSALGFGGGVYTGDDGMQPQLNGEFAMSGDGAASLEDWFSGTQHVLGLLEEDLSFIKTL